MSRRWRRSSRAVHPDDNRRINLASRSARSSRAGLMPCWTDPGGTDVARRDLAEEALFLGSLVAELLPHEAEALGLLALMLHAEARRRARRNAQGEYVPLAEQDTSL